jgi:hypothetical protein
MNHLYIASVSDWCHTNLSEYDYFLRKEHRKQIGLAVESLRMIKSPEILPMLLKSSNIDLNDPLFYPLLKTLAFQHVNDGSGLFPFYPEKLQEFASVNAHDKLLYKKCSFKIEPSFGEIQGDP